MDTLAKPQRFLWYHQLELKDLLLILKSYQQPNEEYGKLLSKSALSASLLFGQNSKSIQQLAEQMTLSKQDLLIYLYYRQSLANGQNDDQFERDIIEEDYILKSILTDTVVESGKGRINNQQDASSSQQKYSKQDDTFHSHSDQILSSTTYQQSNLLETENINLLLIIKPKCLFEWIQLKQVRRFSYQHSQKIMEMIQVCLRRVQQVSHCQDLSISQLTYLVKELILPILVAHPKQKMCLKAIELIKIVLNDYALFKANENSSKTASAIQHQMSETITQFYLEQKTAQQRNVNNKNNNRQQTQSTSLQMNRTKMNCPSSINQPKQNSDYQKYDPFQLQKTIVLITAIQAIHSGSEISSQNGSEYNYALVSSDYFTADIYQMLLCTSVESKTANTIAVNVYGSLLKQTKSYTNDAQCFINLYSTIRCFGTHLIKDIWESSFYELLNSEFESSIIYSKAQLLRVIFYKIQHHENANVVKFCTQSILQHNQNNKNRNIRLTQTVEIENKKALQSKQYSQQTSSFSSSYILFKETPEIVYKSLMSILNYGTLYQDCLFHMDSKMFNVVGDFFADFFNSPQCEEYQLEYHLNSFWDGIVKRVTFQHSLVAVLNCFVKMGWGKENCQGCQGDNVLLKKNNEGSGSKRQSNSGVKTQTPLKRNNPKFFQKKHLLEAKQIIEAYCFRLPLRKRHQMMKSICWLVKDYLSTTSISSKQSGLDPKASSQADQAKNVSLIFLIQEFLLLIPEQTWRLKFGQSSAETELREHMIYANYFCAQINKVLATLCQQFLEIDWNGAISSESESKSKETFTKKLKAINFLTCMIGHSDILYHGVKIDLNEVYGKIYDQVIDIGQSLYKSQNQRANTLSILSFLIKQDKTKGVCPIQKYVDDFNRAKFVSNVLNSISLLIKENSEKDEILLSKSQLSIVVGQCFRLIYSAAATADCYKIQGQDNFSSIQSKSQQNQKITQQVVESCSKTGSQFLQWICNCFDNQICMNILITILKTRIQQQKIIQLSSTPQKRINYIQESIYSIFTALYQSQLKVDVQKNLPSSTQTKNNLHKQISKISPISQLRMFVLTSTILFDDKEEMSIFVEKIYEQLEDLADRYDFQNYDEIFFLIETIYNQIGNIKGSIGHGKDKNECERIAKLIKSLVDSMLSSLDYGLDAKEVFYAANCAVTVLFTHAERYNYFNHDLVNLCLQLVKIGQKYWMFHRVLSFSTIQQLSNLIKRRYAQLFQQDTYQRVNAQKINMNFTQLFPFLEEISHIQEYRGYDSSVCLEQYCSRTYEFYTQLKLKLSIQADYEGVTCRLSLVDFLSKLIRSQTGKIDSSAAAQQFIVGFLKEWFFYLLERIKEQSRQKMFLTGTHKKRLKNVQTFMAFNTQWLLQRHFSQKNYKNQSQPPSIKLQDIIMQLLEITTQNILSEIKYYIELFLMKLLTSQDSVQILTQQIITFLVDRLFESISQVNKNVSFIVISGMTLNHLLFQCQLQPSHLLYPQLKQLFHSLLSYCCSHVAYFRGLSQYFCLERILIESDYTKILRQNYNQDQDTILLRQKVSQIYQAYIEDIKNWTVETDLICMSPNLNDNIVSKRYYMDKLKRLGHQLVKDVKHQVGFLPYKDLWKESFTATATVEENKAVQQIKQNDKNKQNNTIVFQRKIDPSLDFIYLSKTKLEGFNMKILVTGSDTIPIYGHLSRTGQIFGLSELIIPNKKMIQNEQYKSISCTAQKWLNISQFDAVGSTCKDDHSKSDEQFQLCLQKQFMELKQQGYHITLLKKEQFATTNKANKANLNKSSLTTTLMTMPNKSLLVVDTMNLLSQPLLKLIDRNISFGEYFSTHVEAAIFIWQYFKSVKNNKV